LTDALLESSQRTNALLEQIAALLAEGATGANPPILPLSQDLGQVGQALGHDSPRPKTAAQRVQEYLEDNPQDANLPVRDLAEKIGVGKSTVSRVLQEIKN